jgi:hypothetical protein
MYVHDPEPELEPEPEPEPYSDKMSEPEPSSNFPVPQPWTEVWMDGQIKGWREELREWTGGSE